MNKNLALPNVKIGLNWVKFNLPNLLSQTKIKPLLKINYILIGWFHKWYLHIGLSFGVLKSSDKNVIMVFLLSILPSYCIRVSTTFPVQILGEIIKIFSIYVIAIFNLDR